MIVGVGSGRRFGWLWAAYTVSAVGTGLAFDALPLVAILLLHAGPAEVAALVAAGRAAGALLAVPVGPWVEVRRKRRVMVGMDLLRAAALLSVPAAALLAVLGLAQLVVVAVITAAADHAFRAAAGAYLKSIVRPDGLLGANSRFEATTWTTTALGPPLGGALVGLFGPLVTCWRTRSASCCQRPASGRSAAWTRSRSAPDHGGRARSSPAGGTSWPIPSCGRCWSTPRWSTA